MPDPRLGRPLWRGRRDLDALTIAVLERAEEIAERRFTITQGSYNGGGVAASAGTHDAGGAVDLSVRGLSSAQVERTVLALRRAGGAAWHRLPSQGPWPEHIHMIVVDHPLLSPAAARQVVAYRQGRNGLAGNGRDDGPRIPITAFPWEDYMATSDEILRAIARLDDKVDALTAELAEARRALGLRVSTEADGVVDRLAPDPQD